MKKKKAKSKYLCECRCYMSVVVRSRRLHEREQRVCAQGQVKVKRNSSKGGDGKTTKNSFQTKTLRKDNDAYLSYHKTDTTKNKSASSSQVKLKRLPDAWSLSWAAALETLPGWLCQAPTSPGDASDANE